METKRLMGSRQARLFLIVFASMFLLLALAYYYFLRTEYTVLYTDLRPADASAVVAELDEQAVDYQLRDGGGTILVPADQAASVRLAIVGTDIPLKGLVGFELFNKSDMGLTDFAQKINYQRALQGEIARTIMMMEGVENARVHLALPDRSLFRGNRSEPKAAVTVMAARDKVIGEARVVGIQRLVAAAVPDLALSDVVVLDEVGRVISHSLEADAFLAPEAEERSAVQQYYRARIRTAVANAVPGLRFDVRLLVVPDAGASEAGTFTRTRPAVSPPAKDAGARDFQLRIAVLTSSGLNPEDQELIRNAVSAAVGLKEEKGDSLAFDVASSVGPAPISSPSLDSAAVEKTGTLDNASASWPTSSVWAQNWWFALAAFLALLVVLFRRSGEPNLSTDQRDDFVRRIRQQLGHNEEADDAAA